MACAYPQTTKIRLVQDNLNTHHPECLDEYLPAPQALALVQRFEFYYTPKRASWLNMIEIEFAAVSKQCLNRRIATQTELERQVLTLLQERHQKQIEISWQFSLTKARTTFDRHYQALRKEATNVKIT